MMKMLERLDLLREVYSKQALSPEYSRQHGIKVMIRDAAQEVGDLIYGAGLDDVLDTNPYINYTLNNVETLGDSELFTRLTVIFNSVQKQVSKLIPVFFQYEHGVFIVQQSPNGDIVTSKWWNGGNVSFKEGADLH